MQITGFFLFLFMQLVFKTACLRTFEIDYENDQFLMDDRPFRFISGSLHYFRVPRIYWEDRLNKMRLAGLNTVQTYVEWNQHEPLPWHYNFDDELDVVAFIHLAQKLGLYVLLRPGPYICAEREMGGLPFWLLRENPKMKLRTNDPDYVKFVDRWFNVLLPKIKPLLYSNGGPIIAVQIENEYGNYPACDKNYMAHLRDRVRYHLGNDTVLYTTDAAHDASLDCGTIDGVYKTVDFEPVRNVTDAFATMRRHQPHGPLVNSELYVGWLDHWSYPHATIYSSIDVVVKALDEILAMNASVNIYMFHGGTSFGFSNGANMDNNYMACPTSYDYNAPISEAGDLTEKYFALRKIIQKYYPLPPEPMPGPSPKHAYGKVTMKPHENLFELLKHEVNFTINSPYPLTFEALDQAYGFVVYETILRGQFMDPAILQVPGLRDRGIVFINEKMVAILSRQQNLFSVGLRVKSGQKLTILVENQGRIGFGPYINDSKGVVGNVTLDRTILTPWRTIPLPFNTIQLFVLNMEIKFTILLQRLNSSKNYTKSSVNVPGIFFGSFRVQGEPLDSFLSLPGWTKGVAFLNGNNLGRYWPAVGPQMTLYVPKSFLSSNNILILFELEEAPCGEQGYNVDNSVTSADCSVEFVSTPVINATTPN